MHDDETGEVKAPPYTMVRSDVLGETLSPIRTSESIVNRAAAMAKAQP